MVAQPSPSRVRCRPGSATKFSPTVEEMAHMSPMCSTMVASAMGIMMAMEETSMPPSQPLNRENTVSFHWKGMPIQAASFTAVKSTRPKMAATT